MGPLQLASLSIPRKHAKTHSMLRFLEVSTVKCRQIMQNHASFRSESLGPSQTVLESPDQDSKLGLHDRDRPGYEESNQSGKSGISLFGLEMSYQQKSIEIHRPTCLDANTRNHFLRNVQSCLGLGRLNLAKDAAYQRLALQHNSRFVLSQPRTNLNILEENLLMCRDCAVLSWSDTMVQVLIP